MGMTVHQSILDHSDVFNPDDTRRQLWEKLCQELGESTARQKVYSWLNPSDVQ